MNLSFSCFKWYGIFYFFEVWVRCGKNVWFCMNYEKVFNKIFGFEVVLSYCYLVLWILKELWINDCMMLLFEVVKFFIVIGNMGDIKYLKYV